MGFTFFKTKSFIFTAVFMIIISANICWAEDTENIISEIVIQGTKNVKEKVVSKAIKSREGKAYSESKVKADLSRILELEYFENVEVFVDTATWRITYKVTEKPYIKTINFKGNKKFSKGRLKQEIELKVKKYFDIIKLDQSKEKIYTLYADKGYPDCKIEVYPTTDERTNQMTVTFLITEGNRILIGKVDVEGVKAFKPKKIVKKMKKTRRKKVYKEENLNKDIDSIIEFYKNRGYVQIQVGEPKITYNPERTLMYITLPINEGAKYKIGTITFSGNQIYTENELQKVLTLKPKKIYKEEKFQESHQSLVELYSDKGYLNCRVIPEFNPDEENGLMNIHFDITENQIVYVGKIYVDGLTHTKEFVITRELVLKEGDVFAATKVRRSIEKIHNLGFIDAVEPEVLPTNVMDVMDLVFNITEGKPGVLSAGAGYSSVDHFVGTLQVQHINLLHRAQRLNLLWEFGARRQNYEIDWTEPWFLNKPTSLGFSIFNMVRTRDYSTILSAYKEGRKGGSIRLGPRLSDYLSLLFSYSYEEIEVFDVDETPVVKDNVPETHDITSSISSQVVWDTRDNIFNATRGNRQSLAVQLAGGPLGGNINFVKPITKSSWFFPTIWKFVLSLNATVGLVENFGDSKDVPIYERFYVGGAETIRGYKYRSEIGPDEGGKMMSIFNLEYKFPIVEERKRPILMGAFFLDVGGSWENPGDFTTEIGRGEKQMKSGVGFGIRFTTPVFPLRLDWGYGLNHQPGEELSQFYFTIGNIF
ncbi:MAG: outer membrane protein assembly factor BamA [Endomicrobiales bacterium]|nr:outer membrane protein assembly factor BamA [Endomicrobiales bacterium]